MRDQTSGELVGWLAYLRIDDEVQLQRATIAMIQAFGGGARQTAQPVEEEEVIDTTSPDFVKNFAGFTGAPGVPHIPQQNTEILLG